MIIYCERCTMRCKLDVEYSNGEAVVQGNLCNKGKEFGETEIIKPKRSMYFKIPVTGGYFKEVFIKTDGEIPRELWDETYEIIYSLDLCAPIEFGEIIIENILGTGVNIISDRKI